MKPLDIQIITHPALPLADVTPLERLVLSAVLSCDADCDGLTLFTDLGPVNPIRLKSQELIAAFDASKQVIQSTFNAFIAARILGCLPSGLLDPKAEIEIDLGDFPWMVIVQDIVARSAALDEVKVIQWINHPSQRPETFGATVSLITAKAIHHATSEQLLDGFRAEDRGLTPVEPRPWREPEPVPSNSLGSPSRTAGDYLFGLEEVDMALMLWEAMLYFRGQHESGIAVPDSIRRMSEIWTETGWQAMRRFALEIAAFAIDVKADLALVLDENAYSIDFEFVPALVETLLWSKEGPYREGEPENFLEAVTDALQRRRRAAIIRHAAERGVA